MDASCKTQKTSIEAILTVIIILPNIYFYLQFLFKTYNYAFKLAIASAVSSAP